MKKILFIRNTIVIGGFFLLLLGPSCEKEEMTRSQEMDEESKIIDTSKGISFNLESDSLKEEIEEINIYTKEWDDKGMDVDI